MRGRPLRAWLLVLVGGVTPTASLTPLLPRTRDGTKASFPWLDLNDHLPLYDGNQMGACLSGGHLQSDYQPNRATGQAKEEEDLQGMKR